jgi:PAS domain S-box-containing protein
MVTVGLFAGIVYWLVETALHHYLFGSPGFELLPSEPNELWMRSTVFVLFFVLGLVMEDQSKRSVLVEIRNHMLEQQQLADAKEKKQLAAKLDETTKAARHELQLISQISPEGFFIVDTSGRVLDVNDAYCSASGYAREELLGNTIGLVDAHTGAETLAERLAELAAGGTERYTVLNRAKDGRSWTAEVSASRPEASDRIFVFVRDISEQTHVATQSQHFMEIVRSSEDAIVGWDLDGRVTSWNPAAGELFGHGEAEMIGQPFSRVLPEELHNVEDELIERLERGETIRNFPTTRLRADGSAFAGLVTISPVHDEEGTIIGASEIFRPVEPEAPAPLVERVAGVPHDHLQALERRVVAAEAATAALSDYIANMAREFQQPLSSILGAAQQLKPLLGEAQLEPLRRIGGAVNQLVRIINDTIDYAKLEAGRFVFEPVDFAPAEVLARIVQSTRDHAAQKGLEFTADIAELPPKLHGDAGRLAQLVANYLGNALKYTEQGHVRLAVEIAEARSDEVVLRVEVEDTGIGIAPERLATLFAPGAPRDGGGPALGLAINRLLATAMGGEVGVSSAPGAGSRFWFTVRFGCVHA